MQVSNTDAIGIAEKNGKVTFTEKARNLGNLFPEWRLGILVVISAFLIFMGSHTFFSPRNLETVTLAIAIVAIAALGQLFAVIVGGIDLSTGSVMGLAGLVTAMLMAPGLYGTVGGGIHMWIAIPIGLIVGTLIGVINGVLHVRFGITPFIVTLATLQVARGITIGIPSARTITGLPDEFVFIGNGHILGIPISVCLLLILLIIVSLFLALTPTGRDLYAIGGNRYAARLAGVNVNPLLVGAYAISGFFAALSGILVTAKLGAAVPNAGTGYELTVIAAVVIGGASLSGGVGRPIGLLFGAIILGMINNALVLLRIPTYWQQVFIGGIIMTAAILDRVRRQ